MLRQTEDAVLAAVADLFARDREVFLMRHIEKLSHGRDRRLRWEWPSRASRLGSFRALIPATHEARRGRPTHDRR